MFISPDPLLTFHRRNQSQWQDSISEIKELYFDHKFKQCVALCDEAMMNKEAHPLHQSFLHFYAAICHESLGLLAHNFSNKKIPFLKQARDHFMAALAALPLPYCTTKTSTYDCIDDSPRVLNILASPSSIYDPMSPTPLPQLNIREQAAEKASWEASDDKSSISSVPNVDRYTFRQPNFNNDITSDQRHRLSQSLSVGHVMQEDLLPKALFATKKSAALPPSALRALPPIPTRDPVLRKTALQTQLNPSVFAISDSSPITPRFQHIRESFEPKFSQALPARHLLQYNALLSGFRTQLLYHVATVDSNLSATTALQLEHRKNRMSRLASIWSVKEEDVEAREKKERIERLRKGGWNVTKRAHGWKGQEYYEELRYKALADVGR